MAHVLKVKNNVGSDTPGFQRVEDLGSVTIYIQQEVNIVVEE